MKQTITRQHIADEVSRAAGISRTEAAAALEAVIHSIRNAVAAGDDVQLRGFGTFRAVLRREKRARDISRGKTVVIPARLKPVLRPSREFVEMLDKK